MEIHREWPALTSADLRQVQRDCAAGLVIRSDVAARLLNDLLRKEQMCRIYYNGLGPADGDFRQEAMEACFSRKLLIQMGELDEDEDEDEDE